MTERSRFLVTGGAGYVGSHVVAALRDAGHDVLVFDNLRTGHREAVPDGVTFVEGDLADRALVDTILASGPWDGVLHFAALSLVGESMQHPLRYMEANAGLGFTLIDACIRHGVKRFVFSSTAALFGQTEDALITEATPIVPGSPYGESKHMVERALLWADRIHGLRSACLRYFNAAGADPDGRLGEDHRPETHLIPLVIDAALGRREALHLFGDDYPTPDGTCIRDYVHVTDLAHAHLAALDAIHERSVVYNVGTGRGHSNMEVIRSVERVTGRVVPWHLAPRRPGDPARLVAGADRLRRETGWTPRFVELDEIVATAYRWRLEHPEGYGPNLGT
ncbi:UDP-glucose 4-epimerase [Gluconacetobacter liquefaciens NRIC 0522]|uniref:UDP-glucose 4-epimerase n=1 Tax=Gluconacetobacter liquefaciens TaxID=89584 RepID=A0A370G503_GLULI|nr:UDP-glucose 4-epimerase GalE [Gluconacetobacter liquefaciens]MBB2187155.1 UDP-glucose 4-epimerase GalE [Gluconacetobacter liquefaciens]RDI37133.1 UDP-glucose 4-epimerase [Gluconacetobacter liquefaciens]GBQ97260.1 UDP-glucose 4-epimerase [Gluconacetobacter liquefaciens NRIC 0522]